MSGTIKTRWALRVGATSTQRILMSAMADGDGLSYDGAPAAWKDIATFGSYVDSERVLRTLQRDMWLEEVPRLALFDVIQKCETALTHHDQWCGHYAAAPGDPSYNEAIDAIAKTMEKLGVL